MCTDCDKMFTEMFMALGQGAIKLATHLKSVDRPDTVAVICSLDEVEIVVTPVNVPMAMFIRTTRSGLVLDSSTSEEALKDSVLAYVRHIANHREVKEAAQSSDTFNDAFADYIADTSDTEN